MDRVGIGDRRDAGTAPPPWEADEPDYRDSSGAPWCARSIVASLTEPPTPERDEKAVSDQVKQGHELFFGKAKCRQCHAGNNFTDSKFHNLGIGWDPVAKQFSDEGRFVVTKNEADRGAFKTPTLRDVTKHPPYLHDGSGVIRDKAAERGVFPQIK